jgi:hypothetical protein
MSFRKPFQRYDYREHLLAKTPNASGEPRPEAGAQRTLEGVGSTALFGPDSVGETQHVEKSKPYLAGLPALFIMRNGAAFRMAKTGRAYFAC